MIELGSGFPNQESRMIVSQRIEMGRGGVYPNLTDEQYSKLKRETLFGHN
jgi:hypothetical protein